MFIPKLFRPALAFLLFASGAAAEDGEFRGLWADAWGVGFLNQGQVDDLVQAARTNNFNAIVVQMRRRGDAFYLPQAPNGDPRTTALAPGFDALAALIDAAHNGSPRIEIHCWVTTFPVWSSENSPPPQPGHIFNKHPEYLMENSAGDQFIGEGYYVDPGHPEAAQWTARMAKDIVSRYDIDGFHWDYIRYPAPDAGYNPTAIARFNEEFGRTGQPAPNDPQFATWRRRQVSDFLRWANADLLEIRPDLAISAAVFSNRNDAFENRYQDWSVWNTTGIIDLCMPMTYTTNNSTFTARADDANAHQGIRRVYVGPGAYLNTKENTVTQLNYVRDSGFLGSVLYSYRVPNSGTVTRTETLNYIRENFQPTWKDTPALPWKTTTGIVKGRVIDSETGEVVYNARVTLDAGSGSAQWSCVQGGYAFYNVAGGEYTVSASANGLVATETVTVTPGEVTAIDLLLDEGEPPAPPQTIRLTDFEDVDPDSPSGTVLFRNPTYSGSTGPNLHSSPNSVEVTETFPAGMDGARSLRVDFAFEPDRANPWLRLTTNRANILPNPTIPLDRAIRFDIHVNQDVYVAVGIRDNGALGPVGSDGGISGGLEWAGGTTDNVRNEIDASVVPPLGRLVPAGEWITLHFDLPNEPVKAFTGTAALDYPQGVLEHLVFVPVIAEDGTYSTAPFEVYLDNFDLTFEAPSENPPASTFETWAENFLPADQRAREDDPDGYGISNLLRYAFDMDPLHPAQSGLPQIEQTELIDGEMQEQRLTITFVRRTDDPDLTYSVDGSDELTGWTPIDGNEEVEPRDENTETVTVIDTEPLDDQTKRFLRLRVE